MLVRRPFPEPAAEGQLHEWDSRDVGISIGGWSANVS